MIERKGMWAAACLWISMHVQPAAGQDVGHTHYSPLAKVTAANVRSLGLAWEYDRIQNRGSVQRGLEATPLIVDGVMYVSGPWSIVYALDARTGRELWFFDPKVEGAWARKACCDVVNRGAAVSRGNAYVGTVDGYQVALDALDGRVEWKVDTLTDRSRAYVINGAPAIAGDNVVIGNAGADMGVRGYVSAFNARALRQTQTSGDAPAAPRTH